MNYSIDHEINGLLSFQMDQPVMIVTKSLELQEQVLKEILADVMDIPVVVVSICGAQRLGKSFMMNYVLHYLLHKVKCLKCYLCEHNVYNITYCQYFGTCS